MNTIHRTLDGDWAECTDPACPLKFHFENTSVAEMTAMPYIPLLQLLAVIDPPRSDLNPGLDWQEWRDAQGQRHRDYDLPAVVYPDGSMEWYQHGDLHRNRDKPAQQYLLTQRRIWNQHGDVHRDGGKPAILHGDGSQAYLQHGRLHRANGDPAVTNRSSTNWLHLTSRNTDGIISIEPGTQEWWIHGVKAERP